MHTTITICPVCGYDSLDALVVNDEPYFDGSVCPSCGTEFSYTDAETTHEQLRQRWIHEKQAQWWSRFTPPQPLVADHATKQHQLPLYPG